MIEVEKSIIIHRPIEEVFAFVGDQRNAPQWQSGVLEVRRTTEGPLGIGTKHTFLRKFLGRKIEASNEYVEYEPNKKITFKSTSGPTPFEASYLFESTAEGTKLTSKIEMQPGGFFGLAEPLIAASLRREMEAGGGDLKDLLENRVAEISS
jgi:uncharacterized protein YndB with AHSA1/START domain